MQLILILFILAIPISVFMCILFKTYDLIIACVIKKRNIKPKIITLILLIILFVLIIFLYCCIINSISHAIVANM